MEDNHKHNHDLPLYFYSASSLAAKIRRREITSVQLTELYIQRIKRLDDSSTTNSVIVRCFEAALEKAKWLDDNLASVIASMEINKTLCTATATTEDYETKLLQKLGSNLYGVPITVKENNDVKGLRTTVGNPLRNNNEFIAKQNSIPVERLVNDGGWMVLLGKTNLPIGCNDVQTYNPIWGTTRNPFDLSRTPGGSSGGSAAAIASGFAALELGGDIGGSIRVPAALCGIFGHKSTHGLIPTQYGPYRLPDIVVKGPLARSAFDLELALYILVNNGYHPSTPESRAWKLSLPQWRGDNNNNNDTLASSSSSSFELSKFRVAVWDDDPCCPVDSDVKYAIHQLVKVLRSYDCIPVKDNPIDSSKYGWYDKEGSKKAFNVYKSLLAVEENLHLTDEEIEQAKQQVTQKEEPSMNGSENIYEEQKEEQRRKLQEQVRWITQSKASWNRTDLERQKMRSVWETFFQKYDVLVCPITAVGGAWPINESGSGKHEWEIENDTSRVRTSIADKNIVQHFWQINDRILTGADGHQVPYHDQVFWSGVTNICGNPSTVFPAGFNQSSSTNSERVLPVGLQIVGSEWNDLTTIAFAKALEKEAGYKFHPPQGY